MQGILSMWCAMTADMVLYMPCSMVGVALKQIMSVKSEVLYSEN